MFQNFHDEFHDNWEIGKIPTLSSAFYSNKYSNNDSDKHYYLVNKTKNSNYLIIMHIILVQ